MIQPGRNFNSSEYRFGFQGQEKDDEISGVGNSYTAQFWQYDPRLGRRWNIDPVIKEWESSYACFANNPILFVDPFGLDTVWVFDQENNPEDRSTYTANIYHEKNGYIHNQVEGSSYPNYPDTESGDQNTVDDGTHLFNNESGHSLGTKKGLNLVNSDGERVSPGTKPDGTAIEEMTTVNVHEGDKESNRGSAGCLTIRPDHASEFFRNFDWSGNNGTTGTSSGSVVIYRGDSKAKTASLTRINNIRTVQNRKQVLRSTVMNNKINPSFLNNQQEKQAQQNILPIN